MMVKQKMKKNSWTFKSRYGKDRRLTKIEDSLYALEGVTMFTRGCFNDGGIEYFDLEGGPFVQVGDTITDTFFGLVKDDRKIISIKEIPSRKEYAYILVRVS